MASSKNLSTKDHALLNTMPRIIGKAEDIALIKFWDVGTGNCNMLVNSAGTPLVYFDFGGNMGTGAKTYPYRAAPTDPPDGRPVAAFPHDQNKVILVMSHWDNDHVYSLKAMPAMESCNWLGPREDIAPATLKFIKKLGKKLRVWQSGKDGDKKKYVTTGGVTLRLARCRGNPLQTKSKREERNDTGIAMILEIKTPTRAAQVVKKMEEYAKVNANDPNGTLALANQVAGNDIYKECVVAAATEAAGINGATSSTVATAAKNALTARGVVAVLDALLSICDDADRNANALVLLVRAVIAASKVLDFSISEMLREMGRVAEAGANGWLTAAAGAKKAPFFDDPVLEIILKAFELAAQQPTNAQAILNFAQTKALPIASPQGQPVFAAIQNAVQSNAQDAPGAALAALQALPQGTHRNIGRAAIQEAINSNNGTNVVRAAMLAAITVLAPRFPLFGRVIGAATGSANVGGNATAIRDAAINALAQAPRAEDLQVIMKMRKDMDVLGTNEDIETLAGDPVEGEYYTNYVIRAVRQSVESRSGADDPPGVLNDACDVIRKPPVEWLTRVLLTGDACFQSLPTWVLQNTEWDVLLAYHHGSRDNLVPGKVHGNVFDPPTPVLEDISTICYSAGQRANGSYVHKHPEAPAIQKYQEHGWTKELHTHPWNGAARGDREYKLPYTP